MSVLLALVLAFVQMAEKPQTFAACSGADVATTVYAVHTGVAHETNRLLAPAVNVHHYLPLLLSKVAVVGAVWMLYDAHQESEVVKAGVGVASVVTCGVAVNNVIQILK